LGNSRKKYAKTLQKHAKTRKHTQILILAQREGSSLRCGELFAGLPSKIRMGLEEVCYFHLFPVTDTF